MKKRRPDLKSSHPTEVNKIIESINTTGHTHNLNTDDLPVARPAYYTQVRHQVIDVCIDWKIDFLLGNVLKYIQRAGHKPGETEIQALRKAQTYLQLRLDQLEGKRNTTHGPTPDRERNDTHPGRTWGKQKG